MKKSMIAVAVVAGLVIGCTTIGKLADTAQVVAETGPAMVSDAKSLWGKGEDVWKWMKSIWTPSSPSTNAPAAK